MVNEDDKEDNESVGNDGNEDAASTTTTKSKAAKRFQVLESQGFIVGKTLGQGSYACVRSAYDVNRKHKVAVKIISKRKAPNDFLLKFLPREIEVIKILKHPCLISFYQVIETTTRFFLIMELGHIDLLDYIRSKKTIPESQCGLWFRQFHDGMLYMHSKGVVHRDLKCENVLLDKHFHLKVTDFGFAKKIQKTKNGDFKPSETYCGSYAYAPPEILKGTPYDPFFADVWSMGVVLFTMLYGRLPFDDSNHKKLLKQVLQKVVFPAKPEVSEDCRILIVKMLSKMPERVPLSNIQFDTWFKKYAPVDEEKSKEAEDTTEQTTTEENQTS
ncbi:testis-specific serine/threonine-protein kinase 4-like [Saccostrea echinata]|uniref:testis-specific serine/threonine-protein kinase 4-like n=1 Tax=Saccostrea echinata TaxID=191078 RepID=UPI002A816803|nr:testis-specific serine/threonine-protein kinase 4-like [Saccostrea echinata]